MTTSIARTLRSTPVDLESYGQWETYGSVRTFLRGLLVGKPMVIVFSVKFDRIRCYPEKESVLLSVSLPVEVHIWQSRGEEAVKEPTRNEP